MAKRETNITSEKGVSVGPWTLHLSKATGVAIATEHGETNRSQLSALMETVCKTELTRLHGVGNKLIAKGREEELEGIVDDHRIEMEGAQAELEILKAARLATPKNPEVADA